MPDRSPVAPELIAVTPADAGAATVDLEQLGTPGLPHTLYVVDQPPGAERGPEPGDTTRRTFVLWASVVVQPPIYDMGLTAGPVHGDSLIDFGAEGFGIAVGFDRADPVELKFHANRAGRLGLATGRLEATSWGEAKSKFLTNLNTLLSIFSWEHQLPLAAAGVGGRDLKNGITCIEYVSPLRVDRRFVKPGVGGSVSPDLQATFSFFREGLANPSPAYRLICFDKTMQMLRRIRGDLGRSIGEAGGDLAAFNRAVDVIIEDGDLALEVWHDVGGWRLHRLHDERLRPLRNQAAHELLEEADGFTNLDKPGRRDHFRAAADAFIPLVHRYGSRLQGFLDAGRPVGTWTGR